MRDKQLCATIGKRMKERRKELNLNLGYIADKMGVNISTAQRYEAGLIDNSKKIVLDSLAENAAPDGIGPHGTLCHAAHHVFGQYGGEGIHVLEARPLYELELILGGVKIGP